MLERLISLVGIAVILGIAILLSEHRRSIQRRVVLWGVGLQLLLGVLILTSFRLPDVGLLGGLAGAEVAPGRWLFGILRDGVNGLLDFTNEGSRFLFGSLADSDAIGMIFAIQVLPTIVFFSSIMAILYHLGIMQKVIELIAKVIRRTMGTSGAETLSVSANIFVGQTEAPLVIRPFVQNMTRSELMAVMTGGFATVAGGVMAAYVSFGVDAAHLLTASVISAPAAMLVAKLMLPERETPATAGGAKISVEKDTANVIEAAAGGASDGLKLALNVGAMLLAFIALVAMVDAGLGLLPGDLSLGKLLGWLFMPLAFVLGVPGEDAMDVGKLMGLKVAINEFVAIVELRELRDVIAPRSFVIATYALCGFANFSSIAIQIGGIGSIAPSRRSELAKLGLRAMFAGALATWLTAAVAALLIDNREAWDQYLDDVEERIEAKLAPDAPADAALPADKIKRQFDRARDDISGDRRGDDERLRRIDRLQAELDRAAGQASADTNEALDPGVLIVIIDGLRPDAVARADTPHLDALADAGAYTDEARSVMPTITRTNFVTFSTGAFTEEHGLVGAKYMDDSWEEHATDGPTIAAAQATLPVPTIFEAADAAGLRAGMFAMKGYELVGARGAHVAMGGAEVFPEDIWAGRYDPKDGGSAEESVRRRLQKNELIVDELEEVMSEQPLDLVLINLGATDYVAHTQGPDTDYYIEAVEASDAMIPRLQEIVREAAPDRAWHIIVGADHAFSQVDREQLVVPHLEGVFEVKALAAAGIEHRIYQRGGRAAELYLRDDGDLARAAASLQKLPWVRRIYADGDVPGAAGDYDDLRVGFPGRRGSIYVITEPPYAFGYDNQGQHGSNDPRDQHVPMWIAGPSLDGDDLDLSGATNADVAPTALDLLGIDPEQALEGSGESLVDRSEQEAAR